MNPHPYDQVLSELQDDNISFVVIGALDGISHDKLFPHAFKNKHWSGLLVEPVKSYFEELKTNYEHRTNLIFENVAITKTPGTQTLYTVDREAIAKGEVPFWCNGISTFNPNGPTISRDKIKDRVVPQEVQCCKFKDLVEKHKLTNIDVLQIDAEGCDVAIFNQIWVCGFRPEIIYIELVHLNEIDKNYLQNLLKNNNYEITICGEDLLAIKEKQIVTHFAKRKRMMFYTQTRWAFGSIHSALCKELYKYDIDADLIDWTIAFSKEQWKEFEQIYDIFVTALGYPIHILNDFAKIPYNRIIGIAHARVDLVDSIKHNIDLNKLLNIACITPYLQKIAKDLNISREFKFVRNGIHFDRFYKPISNNLKKLGYAGSLTFHFEDCKRSNLAQKLSENTNLPLILANQNGERSYLTMPNFYSEVDAAIVSSNEDEACGLPLMEAAAAGRLPISAKIGITRDVDNPPGLILPLEDNDFVSKGIEKLLELKNNPIKFRKLCAEAQQFAHDNYDWKHVISMWADVLNV